METRQYPESFPVLHCPGIAHHQRRRADDKQHPQILHQRHQPHIGPVLRAITTIADAPPGELPQAPVAPGSAL